MENTVLKIIELDLTKLSEAITNLLASGVILNNQFVASSNEDGTCTIILNEILMADGKTSFDFNIDVLKKALDNKAAPAPTNSAKV